LRLACQEHRQDEYRVVIHNGDSPPLTVTAVKTRGNVYWLVFLTAADEKYRLYYGSDQADPAQYDALPVLTPLRQGHATSESRLGEETANSTAGVFVFTLRTVLANGLALGAVVVVLVIGLGWALYQATRRINALPKE
jgi:hypothetical protein